MNIHENAHLAPPGKEHREDVATARGVGTRTLYQGVAAFPR